MTSDPLNLLRRGGLLGDIDVQFARLVGRLAGGADPAPALAAALASQWLQRGHICLDLERFAPEMLWAEESPPANAAELAALFSNDWKNRLGNFPIIGKPGDSTPLIRDAAGRLYLYRYWEYEQRIITFIRAQSRADVTGLDWEATTAALNRLFAPRAGYTADVGQRQAAALALLRPFCIITGGPGTGKTTTLAAILALLLEQRGAHLRIALAAPTGQAAKRMEVSIQAKLPALDCAPDIKAAIPRVAATLHRLLGPQFGSTAFRYNRERPLPYDVVVVDEVSMVPLHLMAKLVAALPPGARLILLGDKDQLASVEEGAILGDLCAGVDAAHYTPATADALARLTGASAGPATAGAPAMRDCIARLITNHRAREAPGMIALAAAVNRGDAEAAQRALGGAESAGVEWREIPNPPGLAAALRASRAYAALRHLSQAGDPATAFAALAQSRILCMNRRGPYGADALNAQLHALLAEDGVIRAGTAAWYAGRPVMVTENDYRQKLFNGDVGVALPDEHGDLRVYFPGETEMRRVAPGRMPGHAPAYAATVHKCQGAEAAEVLLVLSDRDSPLLTRELVYTGVTRARRRVELWGRADLLAAGIGRVIARNSGLRDALWK